MVKKVAMALDPCAFNHHAGPIREEKAISMARKAIAAMREPTEEIIEAWQKSKLIGGEDKRERVGNGVLALHEFVDAALDNTRPEGSKS